MLSQSPPLGTSEPVEVNLESYYRQSQGPVGQETQAYLDKRKTRLAEEQAERDDLQRRYEAGEREPGVSALFKIADFYGVTIDYLVGRTS